MHGNLSVCPAVPVGEMQQLPKRKRSKSPVVTVVRGNPPAEVLPVRIPYTRFDVAHSQPSAPIAFKPFTPYPPAQTHAQAQTQPSQPAFATGEFDAGSDAEPPQDERRPSRHQKEREQQDDQWRMQIPELAFRRICQQAAEPQRRQKLADSLRNEFEARANVAMMQCSQCHSVDCLQRLSPAPAITFVTLQGHISVSAPTHFCTRTGHQYTVHPFSMDCFHATPSRPEIWYDNELLVTTSAAQLSGPTAIQAHCATLQQLHLYNGFDAEKPAIWQNLSSAAAQWRRVESEATKLDNFQLPGMFASQPAAWQRCPCCWKTCQAVMGDACLGITRLRAAASNSHSLQPFHTNGPFISDDVVREHVADRQNIDINLLTPACSEFQAVGSLGRRSKCFDIMGMAALVCRHEFVLVAANLFTEENFAYYDIMLAQLLEQYPEEDGKQLLCFFLDIACQFKPYWDRFHPRQDISMAIGPWHARVHKASCQRQFGARRTPNTGLTFGDNIEHLWAAIRKHAHLLKYMSSASRQDFVTVLIWHLERLKEDKLAVTLQRWYNDASRKRSELQLQLQQLEEDEAGITNDVVCQPATSPMPTPVEKLTWMHEYQDSLEKINLLQPLIESSSLSGAPVSLQQLKYSSELHQALASAASIERKHRINSRWSQDSDEYRTAALERRVFHINQLQNKIVADLDWLRWAQLVISRTSRQHRGTASQLHKQRRQARIRVKQAVAQLQDWHQVLGDTSMLGYDAASLNAEEMELASWVIPWGQPQRLASSLDEQKLEAQERMTRCDEEIQIIARESKDMVLYYEQFVTCLSFAVQQRHSGQAGFQPDSPGCHVVQAHSPIDQASMKQQYTQGQLHLLSDKLRRSELLLQQAQHLSAELDAAISSNSEMRHLAARESDDVPLSPEMSAHHLDLSDIDVADFVDLEAAEDAMLIPELDDAE